MSCDVSGGPFRSFPGPNITNLTETAAQSYRGMLSTSVRTFRQHPARSLILSEEDRNHLTVVCRPISCYNRHRSTRPLWPRRQKDNEECSSELVELHFPPKSPSPNIKCPFDTLSPQIMACLIGQDGMNDNTSRINSDCFLSSDGSKENLSIMVKPDEDETHSCSRTSINSTPEDMEAEDKFQIHHDSKLTKKNKQKLMEKFKFHNKVMDKFDLDHKQEIKNEKRLSDFDAMMTEIPIYQFKDPLPYPLNKLDISQMTKDKVNWREVVRWRSIDTQMNSMLDRILEIDRLQQETEENEIKKALNRQAQKIKSRPSNSRQVTSMSLKSNVRDKRCTENCLQPTCAGDCPDKPGMIPSGLCLLCYQSLFGRHNQEEYSYNLQSRFPADKDLQRGSTATTATTTTTATSTAPVLTARPHSCNADHPVHKTNNFSSSHIISNSLPRPKSSTVLTCFSHSQQETMSRKQQTREREPSENAAPVDCQQQGASGKSQQKLAPPKSRGQRNILLSGKNYHSQRRHSINSSDNRITAVKITHATVQSAKAERKIKKKHVILLPNN